jgi:hypothetical protein
MVAPDVPELAPEVKAALPTFLVVGAPKAGTTSLHRYLSEHPEIAMSSEKEPMCFTPDDWLDRLPRYVDYFERPAHVRGESSTAYSAFPFAPDVPDRVRAVVPDARFIYMLREPVERTLSHYAQNLWDRLPVRPFDELMDDLEDPMNMPVWCSRYATQYERWAERFGPERILVLEQRELADDCAATMRRVFEFLEVDPTFTSAAWDVRHNTADEHRAPIPFVKRLGPRGRAAARRGPLRPLLTRPVPKPELTPAQRERLVAILAPEAERMRALSGLRLEHWSV